MDLQQLKLHAAVVRAFLAQRDRELSHAQSLELISALPGLRTWSEVLAFPDRVTACVLNHTSAGHLATRIERRSQIRTDAPALLELLAPKRDSIVPEIWPAGPSPGLYVTHEAEGLQRLLEKYDEATDGALIYTERAGQNYPGSIDLGENGLWSNGLERVPAGTLIVVGPIELDEQSWSDARQRMDMACQLAADGKRVVVVFDTPTPEDIFDDVRVLVTHSNDEFTQERLRALTGSVSAAGELVARQPFAAGYRRRPVAKALGSVEAIPAEVREQISGACADRRTGLLMLGSSTIGDHWAIDLIAAAVSMTDDLGPAARIMPRHRGTPAKDWKVPPSVAQLPFLPSIESALAQGYRRLVVSPTYTPAETLLTAGERALVIGGGHGSDVQSVATFTLKSHTPDLNAQFLRLTIAVLGVTLIGEHRIPDLYLKEGVAISESLRIGELFDFFEAHRSVRCEDQFWNRLEREEITVDQIRAAGEFHPGARGMKAFLSRMAEAKVARFTEEQRQLFTRLAEGNFDEGAAKLTPRERDMLRMATGGRTAEEIAAALGISVAMVKRGLRSVLKPAYEEAAVSLTRH